ncbi:MAG: hypothetical protein HQL74_14540, partial [Magnetococcales bacterium]|nr:hypothetical protein [Magnetococcales bacterium]
FSQRFEAGLKKLSEGLSSPRTTKNITKIWERIGRLKEKSHGAGQHYDINITPDESGEKAMAIEWKQTPVEGSCMTHPGVYCLRSSEIIWNEECLRKTYVMLTNLEAVFRSTYRTRVRSWSLSSPSTVAGLSEFPVQVRFTGTTEEILGSGEIFCQRGDGAFRGPDISEPLLTSDEAKRSRGRAEIDAGEPLQEVSLVCLHRPGLMPGQLVEVHDALMGQSWRGKITSVNHSAAGLKLVTLLEVVRYVQSSF